ncbi:MAG TPA: type II secretion system F family protein [Longimicrobiales bacterium]
MPVFRYRAAARDGGVLEGVEEAATALALQRSLGARGLYPLEVARAAPHARRRRRSGFQSRGAATVEALRHLATLLDAGFPLDRALEAVSRVAARADVADAVAAVRSRVRAGATLADSLGEHARIFPRLAVGMARAGERGGRLAASLDRLATLLEARQALRGRLTSALLYPTIMLVGSLSALAVLLGYVIPRFGALLEETGAGLPTSTALLLRVGDAARAAAPFALLIGATAVAAAAAQLRTPAGRQRVDAVLLRLPGIGGIRRRAVAARFGHALAALLAAGVPVLDALDIGADSLGDEAAAAEVRRAREEVRAGGRVTDALGRGIAFPYLFLQMIDVGETSGRMPELLARAAAAMQRDLEQRLDRMVRLVEPAMVLLFGGAVGFVALAMLQAIYGIQADAF